MKQGRKDMTSKFGNDSEFYVSSLFMMVKNPNGTRRPDLVAMLDTFDPRLTIELKSGRYNKGVLNDSQLHYAITLDEDYRELFGEEPPEGNGLLSGVDWSETREGIPRETAYYYSVIERVDEVSSFDVVLPFHTIKLRWGDQFIVPHEMGFYYFAIGRSRRTGEPIKEVIDDLLRMIKEDVDEQSSHYERKDSQSWQNIYTNDLRALFFDDLEFTSKSHGKKRIEALREVYPEVDGLERIGIEGPNGNMVYILADPRHKDLFDSQLRSVVGTRMKTVESVAAEREECEPLLEKVEFQSSDLFTPDELAAEGKRSYGGYVVRLGNGEIERLRRLTQWCSEGEVPFHTYFEKVPF